MPSHNQPRPYDLSSPADLARLFRETAGYLRVGLQVGHGTDIKGRRFAMEALNRLVAIQEDREPSPPACVTCHGDRVVRVPGGHGDTDTIPCGTCNAHDMFGRPIVANKSP